jgi:hypothetical protein
MPTEYTPAEKIEALRRLGAKIGHEGISLPYNDGVWWEPNAVDQAHTFLSTDGGAWQAMDRVLWEANLMTCMVRYPETGTVHYSATGLLSMPEYNATEDSTALAVYFVFMQFIREELKGHAS